MLSPVIALIGFELMYATELAIKGGLISQKKKRIARIISYTIIISTIAYSTYLDFR